MAQDYYSDDGAETMESVPEGSGKEPQGDESTALLPISFFPDDPQPGKKCSVRVVRVHDDQVEVEYDHDEETESEPGPEDYPPAPAGNDLME